MDRINRSTGPGLKLNPQNGLSTSVRPAASEKTPALDEDSYTRTPSTRPRDARYFYRYLQDQGFTNACGTTSLAMLMSFWQDKPEAISHFAIDSDIRRANAPTSPYNIRSFLEDNGFRASVRNNATLDDIKGMLDQGVPVQVLYDPDGNGKDTFLHYVDVVDYNTDAQGNIDQLKIADPQGGEIKYVGREEFEKRWGNLQFKGFGIGVNNMMITALPKDNVEVVGKDGKVRQTRDIALPENRNAGVAMRVADIAFDAVNFGSKAWDAIKSTGKKIWSALTSL